MRSRCSPVERPVTITFQSAGNLQERMAACARWLERPFPADAYRAFIMTFCVKVAIFAVIPTRHDELSHLWVLVAAGLTFFTATRWLGALLLLFDRAHSVFLSFPYTINHAFFETWVLLCIVVFGSSRTDRSSGVPVRTILVLTLSVWFYAGAQKLVHGQYLNGGVLALHTLWPQGSMRAMAKALGLPLARVSESGVLEIDVASRVVVLAMSWSVVVLELGLPILAMFRRARPYAFLGLLGLLCAIALPAFELSFFCSAAACLLLALPRAARFTFPALFVLQIGAALLVRHGSWP